MPVPTQRYISKELIHFVGRGKSVDEQFHLFLKIINDGWVLHPPFNPNVNGNLTVRGDANISENEMYAPEIVCFADIPLQDLSIHAKKKWLRSFEQLSSRFISGLRADCQRCRVVHGGVRRLRRTQSRGGRESSFHTESGTQLMHPYDTVEPQVD